jgi:hypothetical protein
MSWRLRQRLLPRAAGDVSWAAWGFIEYLCAGT